MCGIITYKGPKNGTEVVLKGLKSLEYRGYDSWGIASINGRKNQIEHIKKTGKIGSISLSQLPLEKSHICLGHTRWATHGAVTEKNAHPHLSQNKTIAVVHNGIMENFQKLHTFLQQKNFTFLSETDSEIFPNLIQYFQDQGHSFTQAVRETLLKVKGSYAICAFYNQTREVIGARRGSPLVLGIGKNNEYFLASDVPAFLAYTNRVIYLEDNEMVLINKKPQFKNVLSNQSLSKTTHSISWTIDQARKGKYPHFMLKEINEQKLTIKKAAEQPQPLIHKATRMLKEAKGVFFVGCGTSYHACVSAAYVFSHVAKIHVNVVLASELRNYKEFLTPKTLVVALSQSGETADLLDAVKTAKAKKCRTLSIVNVMGSTLTRLCDENMMMNSGPEICVLSTKSYTSQLTILLLLAYSVAGRQKEARSLIQKVSSSVPEIIDKNLKNLTSLAKKLKHSRDILLIGRDLAYPTALEGALKIKEVSYIHAEGFAGAELKHGTIALIEENVPVIVLSTQKTRSLILNNAMEVKSRGAYLIGIDSEDNEIFDDFIQVPDADNANPILMIIPLQILAYAIALARGLDPDKPRNLAKSVTVN